MATKKIKLRKFNKHVKESDVERTLKNEIKKLGGSSFKFKTPGRRSAPDQIVCFPSEYEPYTAFVECKAPGKKPSPQQLKYHEMLREIGYDVLVVDTKETAKDAAKQLNNKACTLACL